MEYTFLEILGDSSLYAGNNPIELAVEKASKKMVGTTVHFETNEFGVITQINNLSQLKRQAKSLLKDTFKELYKMPEMIQLKKEFNYDVKDLINEIDPDDMVEAYLGDLRLLFMCHGIEVDLGYSQVYEEATDSTYENVSSVSVEIDPTNFTYSITTEVVNKIPRPEIHNLLSNLVELIDNESITESFNNSIDTQTPVYVIDYSLCDYKFLPQGWPYMILTRSTETIGDNGKTEIPGIALDYINLH